MDFETFQRLAETHGGDLGRWPPERIKAAATLIESDGRARAVIEAERALDQALDAAMVVVDDDRQARLLAAISQRLDDGRVETARFDGFTLGLPPRWSVGFLASMAVLGIITGALIATPPTVNADPSITAAAPYFSTQRYDVSWNH